MMSINLNPLVILNIHGIDYRWIMNRISKSEAVNLLQDADLSKKKLILKLKKLNLKFDFFYCV